MLQQLLDISYQLASDTTTWKQLATIFCPQSTHTTAVFSVIEAENYLIV